MSYKIQRPFYSKKLPTLEDKSGNVTFSLNGTVIDSAGYSEDQHFPLLDDKQGVSLERIDPDSPASNPGNWHSAASTAGFATPGYENSQLTPIVPTGSNIISIPNRTFSPDGDGFEDVLVIQYAVDQPGYLINIQIFDAYGRLVRKLVQNTLLASEGSFKWDGTTTERTKARIGVYVLWIELFTPEGRIERSKESVVLAGKLD